LFLRHELVQDGLSENVPDGPLHVFHQLPNNSPGGDGHEGVNGFRRVILLGIPAHDFAHLLPAETVDSDAAKDVHPVSQVDDVRHEQGFAVPLLSDNSQLRPVGVVIQDHAGRPFQERVSPKQPVTGYGVLGQVGIEIQPVQFQVHGECADVVHKPGHQHVGQGFGSDSEMVAHDNRRQCNAPVMSGDIRRHKVECL